MNKFDDLWIKSKSQAADYLRQNKSHISAAQLNNHLLLAVLTKDVCKVKMFLDNLEIDINFNVLKAAIGINQLEITKLLLESGANPNGSENLLSMVVNYSLDYKLFKLLLEYGADPNHIDSKGNTVLSVLCKSPCEIKPIIKILSKYNLQGIKNKNGRSYLDELCLRDDDALEEMLRCGIYHPHLLPAVLNKNLSKQSQLLLKSLYEKQNLKQQLEDLSPELVKNKKPKI